MSWWQTFKKIMSSKAGLLTLSFGFKRPETGDRGSVWFPALEDNITQLNTHNHDGSNSAQISFSSIDRSAFKQSITIAGWTDLGNGNFSQVVTTPAAMATLDHKDFGIKFVISSGTDDGNEALLSYTNISATQYTLFGNEAVDVDIKYF